MLEISLLAEKLLASQEGLFSTELILQGLQCIILDQWKRYIWNHISSYFIPAKGSEDVNF
jgi:hypothetical protein